MPIPPIVHGLTSSSYLFFIAQHFDSGLIILPSSIDLFLAQDTLQFFAGENKKVFVYPHFSRFYEPIRQEPTALIERLKTQGHFAHHSSDSTFVLATREALSQKTISKKEFLKSTLCLKKGAWIEREKIIQHLKSSGYRQDDLAEDQGFYSVRGHLLDIFSPFEKNPTRIEFFGDEIISIRFFDTTTQRSLQEISEWALLPCRELFVDEASFKQAERSLKDLGDERRIDSKERERFITDLQHQREFWDTRWVLPAFHPNLTGIEDYFASSLPFVFVDPHQSLKESESFWKEEEITYNNFRHLAWPPQSFRNHLKFLEEIHSHKLFTTLAAEGLGHQVFPLDHLKNELLQKKTYLPLKELLDNLNSQGIKTTFVFKNEKKMGAVQEFLEPLSAQSQWKSGPLFPGFYSSTLKQAFITEFDLFGTKKKRVSWGARNKHEFLRHFSDLKAGDYVIHEDHGVARFQGLQTLNVQQARGEFLLLEYADKDKLYLPVYRLDKLSRYIAQGQGHPKLSKLGSPQFLKKKEKIKKDILKIAHELLRVAAQRKHHSTKRLPIDRTLYQEFCNAFPFDLTSDQEAALVDVEEDLKKSYAMDRLICGDVGFGKTEIALRAAMLTLLQNKQVALVAPTTILVEQHARTFNQRFKNFPFKIAHCSRFVPASEQNKNLKELETGGIDVVIGTHRLLQPDVQFSQLGLLIIDEEQRFGVKHKEKIKKLRPQIDVLTLSATPIPRTLHMSLAGVRELSLIATPPENREAVKTFVASYDDVLIQKACLREKERGGQILVVHNRVQTIHSFTQKLRKILPHLNILVAHGQMSDTELEKAMLEFIDYRADVLVATTIIENGLDIPNANTLIVDQAHQLGLSDLYQLRGRVGRSHRSSSAYFLIHENTPLTPEASKRLQVLQSCTELGSGFKIATHDMEIRGSGNLLGEEQSGIIEEVGLEFYNQLLQETLSELKQEKPREPLPELNTGYSAYIPEAYIPDSSIRISIYKQLDRAPTDQELFDCEAEIVDRFGPPPPELENLCEILHLRLMAYTLKATSFECFPGRLLLRLGPETPLHVEALLPLLNLGVSFDQKGKISYQFNSVLLTGTSSRPEPEDFKICRKFLNDLISRSS